MKHHSPKYDSSAGPADARMSLGRSAKRRGGRSARVKTSILTAIADLLREDPNTELSVSAVATKAGVNYSTVSRNWQELRQPIASLRVSQLLLQLETVSGRPETSSLQDWAVRFSERLTPTMLGSDDLIEFFRALDREVREHIATLASDARKTGVAFPPIDEILLKVISPVVYRRLVGATGDLSELVEGLVAAL